MPSPPMELPGFAALKGLPSPRPQSSRLRLQPQGADNLGQGPERTASRVNLSRLNAEIVIVDERQFRWHGALFAFRESKIEHSSYRSLLAFRL